MPWAATGKFARGRSSNPGRSSSRASLLPVQNAHARLSRQHAKPPKTCFDTGAKGEFRATAPFSVEAARFALGSRRQLALLALCPHHDTPQSTEEVDDALKSTVRGFFGFSRCVGHGCNWQGEEMGASET